jgi:hypothetical protein
MGRSSVFNLSANPPANGAFGDSPMQIISVSMGTYGGGKELAQRLAA